MHYLIIKFDTKPDLELGPYTCSHIVDLMTFIMRELEDEKKKYCRYGTELIFDKKNFYAICTKTYTGV